MSKKKKILLLIIGLSIAFLSVTIFFVVKQIQADKKEQSYIEKYKHDAMDYIKSSDEVITVFGSDFDIEYQSASYKYSTNEYVNWVFYRKIPENLEEFNEKIEYMEFDFKIKSKICSVRFEKDEKGDIVISDFNIEQ